jgi:hypothetical protein
MLIDKGFTKNDIVSLKLLNGDEIIARFESETATEIKIDRPLAITVTGSGLGMIPWIFLGDKDVMTLQRAHVFAMIPSKRDAANQYMAGTTTIALS